MPARVSVFKDKNDKNENLKQREFDGNKVLILKWLLQNSTRFYTSA